MRSLPPNRVLIAKIPLMHGAADPSDSRLVDRLDGDLRSLHRRGPAKVDPDSLEALSLVADAIADGISRRDRMCVAVELAIDDYTDDPDQRRTIKLWYGLLPETRELGPTMRHQAAWAASGTTKSYDSYRTRDLPAVHPRLARQLFRRYAASSDDVPRTPSPAIEERTARLRFSVRGIAITVGIVLATLWIATNGRWSDGAKPSKPDSRGDGTVATWRSIYADRRSPDVPGSIIVARLNAQRSAHGFPASLDEDPPQSIGCRQLAHQHARKYMGATLGPSEQDEDNDLDVAAYSVVDYYVQWGRGSNPAEDSPVHLLFMLAPRLKSVGAYGAHGVSCVTAASLNRTPPRKNVVYSYPSNGTTRWRTEQRPLFLPKAALIKMGISQGDATGPFVFAVFDGPDLSPFAKARLIRPPTAQDISTGEQVAIHPIESRDLYEASPPAVIVAFRKALKPFTTYEVAVNAEVTDPYSRRSVQFVKRWSFTTGPTIKDPKLTLPAGEYELRRP